MLIDHSPDAGFWVQAEAVFIKAKHPSVAIAKYRESVKNADVPISTEVIDAHRAQRANGIVRLLHAVLRHLVEGKPTLDIRRAESFSVTNTPGLEVIAFRTTFDKAVEIVAGIMVGTLRARVTDVRETKGSYEVEISTPLGE